MALTSETLEGSMLREQMAWQNKEKGTVYSPWLQPTGHLAGGKKKKWESCINMMSLSLHDLGWKMDSDMIRWGTVGCQPPGRQEWDAPLEWVKPAVTQIPLKGIQKGRTLLQESAKSGLHWVSDIISTESGEWKHEETDTEHKDLLRQRWQMCLGGDSPDPKWTEAAIGSRACMLKKETCELHHTTGTSLARIPEYGTFECEPQITNGNGVLIAASDGSYKDGKAAFAMRPVQNMTGGAEGRLKGDQSIAKAELIGAWQQLKAALKLLEQGNTEFHGFLDNQGIFKTLRKVKAMTDRKLKRAVQGRVYLREIRHLMQQMPGRITWHWIKSHTMRAGPVHDVHNKTDERAGICTHLPEVEGERFTLWDWDTVIIKENGSVVEGDPRRQIRKRMVQVWWEEKEGTKGRTYRALQRMEPESRALLKAIMGSRGEDKAKKEWAAALGDSWLLAGEYGEDRKCRLCPPCAHLTSPKEKQPAGSQTCNKCIETIEHVALGQCTAETRLLAVNNKLDLEDSLRNIASPMEWDAMGWINRGTLMAMADLEITKFKTTSNTKEDKWVDEYKLGNGWAKWEGIPFTKEDEGGITVDLDRLDESHAVNEYIKDGTETVSTIVMIGEVGMDKVRISPHMMPLLGKLYTMIDTTRLADGVSKWQWLSSVICEIEPRNGPMNEQLRITQRDEIVCN